MISLSQMFMREAPPSIISFSLSFIYPRAQAGCDERDHELDEVNH
jgi:hypothetical protein